MGLPYLDDKKLVATILAKRKPDGSVEEQPEPDDGLQSAASDLIKAVSMKDAVAVARALQSAFEMCDSYEKSESE